MSWSGDRLALKINVKCESEISCKEFGETSEIFDCKYFQLLPYFLLLIIQISFLDEPT